MSVTRVTRGYDAIRENVASKEDVAEVGADVAAIRADLKAEIAAIRADLKSEAAALRSELAVAIRDLMQVSAISPPPRG